MASNHKRITLKKDVLEVLKKEYKIGKGVAME